MQTELQSIIREIDSLGEQMATALFRLSALKERLAALTVAQPVATAPEVPAAVAEPAPAEADTAVEPVGAVRDLRSAFTLNDRYRFRRELFGNSEGEMADTLELLGAMSSMEEAEEYLLSDLGWDGSNDDVAEFLNVIRRCYGR
ncbi:MAG: hypothetical protein K2M97_00255 [Muribaculaceae bacterium]|nr:hypothetical protein [Muribaculaceae bacterium]